MPVAAELSRTHAYVREARRLRGSLAGRPERLYRSLRQLSDRQDQHFSVVDSFKRRSSNVRLPDLRACGAFEVGSQAHVNEFATYVAEQLEGQVLRYSLRLKLLKVADGLGIGRFHANLVIAAVQHQHGVSVAMFPSRRASKSAILPLVVFMAIQCLIMLLAWGIFVR